MKKNVLDLYFTNCVAVCYITDIWHTKLKSSFVITVN